MSMFLIAVTLLLTLTFALLLPPLLREGRRKSGTAQGNDLNLAVLREQLRELDAEHAAGLLDRAAHEQARDELGRRVLEEQRQETRTAAAADSRWGAIALGIALPVLAAALYVATGTPAALVAGQADGHEAGNAQVEGMVAGLAARLQQQPDNPGGWEMLARSYNVMGRYQDAAGAYAQLVKLLPDNAGLLADYADTLAMAQGQSLQGEPEKLVERALAADGKNLKALALSGSAAFERGDFARAAAAWEKLAAIAPPDSDVAAATADSIVQAKRLLAEKAAAGK